MNEDNLQQSPHGGQRRDQTSGQGNGQDNGQGRDQGRDQGNGQIDGEPPRSSPMPNQGLRKRTSILVGLAFVLFGLLMLFIAGDSAASTAPVQCSCSVIHADTSITTQEKSIEY